MSKFLKTSQFLLNADYARNDNAEALKKKKKNL